MPAKIEKRGSSYRLTVVHGQQVYRTTVKAESRQEAEQKWTLFAADVLKGQALDPSTKRMTLHEFFQSQIAIAS